MSQRSERLAEALEDTEVDLDQLQEWYHVPVLAVLLSFMLWVRAHGWQSFVDGDQVLFSGNDAWYHFRMVRYTVSNWPGTMPYDVWTSFPTGTSVGQFGTLFDQLIATAALVVGLGSPTEKQIALTVLFAPAVFGTLAAVPAYVYGRRLGGRFGGLVGVAILAFTPGQFLTRAMVGFSDHHVAETLFMATGVVVMAVAVTVAEEEMPVYELFTARDWDALKRPLGWAALGGVAVALYVWVWPPGVFLVGILGVYFALHLSLLYVRGTSPEYVAVAGATSMAVTGVLTLVPLNEVTFSATNFSVVQPLVAFLVALGCVFMAAVARVWDARDLPRLYYPAAIAGVGVVLVGGAALLVPDVFGFFLNQVLRVVGFGATATSLTVAEAQPVSNPVGFLRQSYGLAFLTAMLGFSLLLVGVLRDDDPRAEQVLLLVWAVFLTLATLTQQRFDYYLAAAVAVLNAYLVGWIVQFLSLEDIRDVLDIQLYQVMTVVAVVLVIVAPVAVAGGGIAVVSASDSLSRPGTVQAWDDSLQWVEGNTPAMGAYGDGTPSDLAGQYYGTFPRTDDHRYEDGEYGVIAWWDYGHWITVLGERPAFANPFQQGAEESANFLLAPNESYADSVLVSEDGEQTRYVMLDYQLGVPYTQRQFGQPKFSAPAAWESAHGVSGRELSVPVFNPQSGSVQFTLRRPRSYHSMRTRLYLFHGSMARPETRGGVAVLDYDVAEFQGRDGDPVFVAVMPEGGQAIRQFNTTAEAREFVRSDSTWPDREGVDPALRGDPTSQVGGIANIPSERIPALEHYRLVHASEPTSPTFPGGSNYPWVKTFERVPGATIEGTGPANTTVTAAVQMRMANANRTFVYRQQARTGPGGEFTMTLPYSSTGYENWGTEEGYTDPTVRATGPYRFTTPLVRNESGDRIQYARVANVSEAHVIGENESAVRIDLRKTAVIPADTNTSTGNDTTDGTTSDTSGENTTDASGSANSTGSLRPPARADGARAAD